MTQTTKQAVEGFSSLQVSRMTGATLRQLQWWDEQDVLRPRLWLGNRVYSAQQLAMVERIVQLRKAGVSLQNLRKLANDRMKPCKSIVVTKQTAVVVGDTLVVFQGRVRS